MGTRRRRTRSGGSGRRDGGWLGRGAGRGACAVLQRGAAARAHLKQLGLFSWACAGTGSGLTGPAEPDPCAIRPVLHVTQAQRIALHVIADSTARKAAPLLESSLRQRGTRTGHDMKDAVIPWSDSEREIHASTATARSLCSSCAAANPSWRLKARRAAVQPDTRRGLAGTREAPRLSARPERIRT